MRLMAAHVLNLFHPIILTLLILGKVVADMEVNIC